MNRSLKHRLVWSTTLIVALVTLSVVVISTFATYQIMIGQVDNRLLVAGERPRQGPGPGPGPKFGVERFGQTMGTIILDIDGGKLNTGAMLTESGAAPVPEAVTTSLLSVTKRQRPVNITLPDLGWYRAAQLVRQERQQIVAIPLTEVSATLRQLLILEVLASALVIGAAYWIARNRVTSQLHPLNRLTNTANQVSKLDLSTGEVQLPVRVSANECDPKTEVGQVGIAFNHMLDNVEQALAARQASENRVRQFVADASHELRNPLAAIQGYAQLTRRDRDQLPEATANALARIDSESERMAELVEDLLLLARLDNQPALRLAPANLGDLLALAVSDAQIAGSQHHWLLHLPESAIRATVDENRITQVVTNLLTNARVHTPAGTHITTALRADGDRVVITVSDDGPGIPAALLPTVFERFARGEHHRARFDGQPSTGLGLAIVAAVTAAHGGQVSVVSTPGNTTFTVELPTVQMPSVAQ